MSDTLELPTQAAASSSAEPDEKASLKDRFIDWALIIGLVVCIGALVVALKMVLVHILCGILFMAVAVYTLMNGQEASSRAERLGNRGGEPIALPMPAAEDIRRERWGRKPAASNHGVEQRKAKQAAGVPKRGNHPSGLPSDSLENPRPGVPAGPGHVARGALLFGVLCADERGVLEEGGGAVGGFRG